MKTSNRQRKLQYAERTRQKRWEREIAARELKKGVRRMRVRQ